MTADQKTILFLITLSACLLAPWAQADLVVFHAEFDDPPVAWSGRSNIVPVEADVKFVDGPGGRALRLTDGARLVYVLPAGLPAEAGSLELLFRADFPQDAKSPARTVLRISGGDAHDLEMYYVPVGPFWRFRLQDSLFAQTGSSSITQDEWVHLLLTWDSTLEPRALTRLYINGGGGKAYDYTPPPKALTTIALGGAGPLEISVDALAVYNRALSQSQAKLLADARKDGLQPYESLTAQVAADDRDEALRLAQRREQVAQLEGRVGRLIAMRGQQPRNFTFPEGIEARGIRPEEVGELDLSQFRVIYFPQGAGYQIDREQQQVIFDYVKNGGGYVGSCAGAYTAIQRMRPRLLNIRSHTFYGSALFPITLTPHPVTDGYGQRVTMHHGNGPIMFPLDDNSRVIGTYPVPQDPENPAGAIVVGRQGKGRLVLFGPHPLGGGIGAVGKSISLTSEDLGTDRMFVNALLFAAGIINEEIPED